MSRSSSGFTLAERRAVLVLGLTYMVRMLGLFMVLPVLALAAERFADATPLLIGLALGAYGLPQALLQIPFGLLSDFIGRKRTIVAGFLIFIAGSLVAAAADTMTVLIVGRALQGTGAVAAVIMALATDLIRAERRPEAFAFIGMGIGLAFMLAVIVGPVIDARLGLRGVFLISAALGVVAVALVTFALPSVKPAVVRDKAATIAAAGSNLLQVLRDRNLLRLNASVFFLHLIMTANFFLLPGLLEQRLGIERASHWMFYAPVLMGSFLLIFPLLRLARRQHRLKELLLIAVALLGVSQVFSFFLQATWLSVIATMVLFFAAFNYLEASLPALVGRFCAPETKGVSMGMFSNGQFLGAFAGGVSAGGMASVWGDQAIYLVNAGAAVIWWMLLAGIDRPRPMDDTRSNSREGR